MLMSTKWKRSADGGYYSTNRIVHHNNQEIAEFFVRKIPHVNIFCIFRWSHMVSDYRQVEIFQMENGNLKRVAFVSLDDARQFVDTLSKQPTSNKEG